MAQTVQFNQRLGGTAFCSINGLTFLMVDGNWRVSTPTRETALGQDGVHGYVEKPAAGQIKVTLRDYGANKVVNIGNVTNSNVVLSLANGKTIVGANVWCTEQPMVSTEDGKFEATFESGSVTEN